MKNQIHVSNQNTFVRHKIRRGSWKSTLFVGCAIACLTLSPAVRAVDPPPIGGYPGENTALGEDALFSYDTSIQGENTACGHDSLYDLTIGIYNTAVGDDTLHDSTAGNNNTAVGWHAMTGNTTGSKNTGIGCDALDNTTTGGVNIALGFRAGFNITTGSNNIDIGSTGVLGDTNTIRIGTKSLQRNTTIAGISGAVVASGVGVIIDTNGHLGTVVSSERYKEAVRPMDKSSEAILALRPVRFRYKKEFDPDSVPQFGLLAEQVAKVNPDLVARDDEGKPYTVRYEAINAMLLNEFLKEHQKVEEQEQKVAAQDNKSHEQDATITRLESLVFQQQKQIDALASQIRKVSDRFAPRQTTPVALVDN